MSKKIVVLTGSPRRNGNSSAMAAAFAEAAAAKGHTVVRYDAASLRVAGCRACGTCGSTGKPCTFDDDDFNRIAPDLLSADVLVFAMPVYWYTMPAQIKAVIDRTYALFMSRREAFSGKACALLACCGDNDLSVLEGVRLPYARAAALNGWRSVGEVLIPGVRAPGDVEKTDGCRRAAALAERL